MTRYRLGRAPAFWLTALVLVSLLAASSAPSPLYVVYQSQLHFGSGTLTTVFGVYAVTLLVALLVVGGLSDHLGRRPVLVASLLLEVVAMLAFAHAHSVSGLLVARALQGVATGAATGVLNALAVDLQPPDDPRLGPLLSSVGASAGLASGALGSGLLVRWTSAPADAAFTGLTVAFVVLAVVVAVLLPETVGRRPGALASLAPRVAVPAVARRPFVTALPVLLATWATGGLFFSLGPSLSAGVLHQTSRFVGALVVVAFAGSAGVASALARDVAPPVMRTAGTLALGLGALGLLAGVRTGQVGVFVAGALLAGAGFGPAFTGALRALATLVGPAERAALLASASVVGYLAFCVPALAAGRLATTYGLATVATGYAAGVVALTGLALGLAAAERRRAAGVPAVV